MLLYKRRVYVMQLDDRLFKRGWSLAIVLLGCIAGNLLQPQVPRSSTEDDVCFIAMLLSGIPRVAPSDRATSRPWC
jgi:hypothetical protein